MKRYPNINREMPKIGNIIRTSYSGVVTHTIVTKIVNNYVFESVCCDAFGNITDDRVFVWDIMNKEHAPISKTPYYCEDGSNVIIN